MNFEGTKNFKVSELESSAVANLYKIDNKIPDEFEKNVKRLLEFLQQVRNAGGSGIRITSGYRCYTLNKAVGGSKTSAHLTCNAVDLQPCNNKFKEFKEFIVKYLDGKLWDQCIIEKSGNKQGVHLGLYSNSGKQRRQIFSIDA